MLHLRGLLAPTSHGTCACECPHQLLEALAQAAPDWWGRANVWDESLPYSSLEAAVEACGGAIKITHDVSDERPAPPLTPDRWHVIQRWRPSGSGHTYLAYCDADGETVTIIQSSEAKGYRHDVGTWTGLDGLDVGVATLEPLT